MTQICLVLNLKLGNQSLFSTELSGSTGIIVVCLRGYIVTGNVGDSRAVLIREKQPNMFESQKKIRLKRRSNSNCVRLSGILTGRAFNKSSRKRKASENLQNLNKKKTEVTAYALSRDLLPSLDQERQRIFQQGGNIRPSTDPISGNSYGPDRIWAPGQDYPGLMMSRSFGDQIAHEYGVTEIPEVSIVKYNPAIHKGLILASDGVWEHITNLQACKLVEDYLEENNADIAVDIIVIQALQMWKMKSPGYVDDTSCILAYFKKNLRK